VESLRNKGYDYWALGHVHRREVLSEDPWIVFPGNLQGRHARETGPKGATLLTMEGGRIENVVHRDLDVVRWTTCEVDAAAAANADDVVDLCRAEFERIAASSDGRTIAVRVVAGGRTRAHDVLATNSARYENELRAVATDVGGDTLWLEQIRFATSPAADLSELARRGDAIGQVAQALGGLKRDRGAHGELLRHFAELKAKLPAEIRDGEDGILLDDPAVVAEALEDAENLILSRLLGAGDDET
jgi:DNA repair exonuclease SbcCD nuclease subunit